MLPSIACLTRDHRIKESDLTNDFTDTTCSVAKANLATSDEGSLKEHGSVTGCNSDSNRCKGSTICDSIINLTTVVVVGVDVCTVGVLALAAVNLGSGN